MSPHLGSGGGSLGMCPCLGKALQHFVWSGNCGKVRRWGIQYKENLYWHCKFSVCLKLLESKLLCKTTMSVMNQKSRAAITTGSQRPSPPWSSSPDVGHYSLCSSSGVTTRHLRGFLFSNWALGVRTTWSRNWDFLIPISIPVHQTPVWN